MCYGVITTTRNAVARRPSLPITVAVTSRYLAARRETRSPTTSEP